MKTRLVRRLRRDNDADDGFSLVEVLVALFVILVVMSALLAALGTSIKTVRQSAERGAASQLASERLEQMQAVAFDTGLGFHAADPDYRATWDGAPTVTLTGTRAVACPTTVLSATDAEPVPPCPLVRRTIQGREYTVRTDITLTDALATASPSPSPSPSAAPTYYYKRLRVQVDWIAPDGGAKQTVMEAFRAPTPEELALPAAQPSATASPTASTTPTPTPTPTPTGPTSGTLIVSPASQVLISGGATSEEMLIRLTTATAPTTVAGGWVNGTNSGTLVWTADAARTTWETKIFIGTSMSAGSVDVTAEANFAGTIVPYTAAATTIDAAAPPVDIQTPTVTPSLCRSEHNNNRHRKLTRNSTVTVEILGVESSDTVKLSWTGPNVNDKAMAHTGPGANGGRLFSAVMPLGTEMHGDSTTLTVSAQRASDPQPATEGFPVPAYVLGGCPA